MPIDSTGQRRAVFFDRDGVINARIKGGYVRSLNEFILNPELADVLREVKTKGYLAIIITNQRGVGRGLMTEADLHEIHQSLQTQLNASIGSEFDDILYCIDADDNSTRRKPSPAMLLEAAERWNIDLTRSWMVGDSASDMEAGARAGTRTAFLVTIHTEHIPAATRVLQSLSELPAIL